MKSTRSFLFPLFILSIGLFDLFDYFMKVNDKKKCIHFIASLSDQVGLNTFALTGVRFVTVSVSRFYSFSFSRKKSTWKPYDKYK